MQHALPAATQNHCLGQHQLAGHHLPYLGEDLHDGPHQGQPLPDGDGLWISALHHILGDLLMDLHKQKGSSAPTMSYSPRRLSGLMGYNHWCWPHPGEIQVLQQATPDHHCQGTVNQLIGTRLV